MNTIKFSTEKIVGKIKPMHAVNNGPAHHYGTANFELFKAAGIPFARNHDASFASAYGGSHTVDISAVFPNFDADVNDPASYDFPCTDKYVSECFSVGAKVFYRLGNRIEHEVKKYHIYAPKDPFKWAQICEHIIRHYTEGWADGFNYDLTYWEIWNEPDLHGKCWIGTDEQFFELYDITAKHLKACFPNIKVGGPAVTGPQKVYNENFLAYVKEHGSPMDFFSYHCYGTCPEDYTRRINAVNELIHKYGFECEKILNEWNYVKAWGGEDFVYSLYQHSNIKGASFVASVIALGQKSELDMLMYYDARPGTRWNGMFDMESKPLKGYYPFYFFNKLYEMANETESVVDGEKIYAVSASGSGKKGFFIVSYNDDDSITDKVTFKAEISGLSGNTKLSYYLVDEASSGELIREETTSAESYSPILSVSKNSIVYIEAEAI